MSKGDTRQLDKEIQYTDRKIQAVQQREMWPLNGVERRAILSGLAGGSYRVLRGHSTGRADRKLETTWEAAEIRLTAEYNALVSERQRVVNEAAASKAAKKTSGWW
jgi:hypothetical protein